MFASGETFTIVRPSPGGLDQYGDPVTGSEERIDVSGCGCAPRMAGAGQSAGEVEERGRQGVIVGLTVYMPYETDLRPTDAIEIRGDRFEVQGEPGYWRSPFSGWKPGLEVAVRRTEG